VLYHYHYQVEKFSWVCEKRTIKRIIDTWPQTFKANASNDDSIISFAFQTRTPTFRPASSTITDPLFTDGEVLRTPASPLMT